MMSDEIAHEVRTRSEIETRYDNGIRPQWAVKKKDNSSNIKISTEELQAFVNINPLTEF